MTKTKASNNGKEIVKIHGRDYETVASRLNRFMEENQFTSIETQIEMTSDGCIIKSMLKILDGPEGKVIRQATGYSYEKQGSSMINKTSFVENAETSSVGRALAFIGYGGSDVRSADEMQQAIHDQEVNELTKTKIKEIDRVVGNLNHDQIKNFECPQKGNKYHGLTVNQIANDQTENGTMKGMGYIEMLLDAQMVTPEGYEFQQVCKRYYEEILNA